MALPPLPEPVREPLRALESAGHPAWLVGRCVRELLSGDPVRDFEVVCLAPADALLRALPRAVVTGRTARRLTLPTTAGPLDVAAAGDASLAELLLHRDLTIHAIALRARGADDVELADPHAGRRDLAARRLRAPGAAKERLAEDPVRALRVLRWMSQLGFAPDSELQSALGAQREPLSAPGGRRVRIEIEGLLRGAHAEDALALLRRSGLEDALAPGVQPDAAQVVARLPAADLELRLAAWLRGTRVRAVLRDLRCPRDRAVRIERLLQLHPVDAGAASGREARARRLLRRDPLLRGRLLALREAEVQVQGDEASRRSLDRLVRTIASLEHAEQVSKRRASLQLRGREVMETLGCGPGATVGRALRFLAEQVAEDPSRNEPETLRRLLLAWKTDYAADGGREGGSE